MLGFTLRCLSTDRSDRLLGELQSYHQPYHQPQKRLDPYPVLRLIIMIRITKSPITSPWRRFLATHTATAPSTAVAAPPTRHDWTKEEVQQIYDKPLLDLVFRSASVHRQHHDPTKIQLCTLMNIKSK
jgi:hypothetical protein